MNVKHELHWFQKTSPILPEEAAGVSDAVSDVALVSRHNATNCDFPLSRWHVLLVCSPHDTQWVNLPRAS